MNFSDIFWGILVVILVAVIFYGVTMPNGTKYQLRFNQDAGVQVLINKQGAEK